MLFQPQSSLPVVHVSQFRVLVTVKSLFDSNSYPFSAITCSPYLDQLAEVSAATKSHLYAELPANPSSTDLLGVITSQTDASVGSEDLSILNDFLNNFASSEEFVTWADPCLASILQMLSS